MPYLRLHLPNVSLEQKRFIANELIDISLRSFGLRGRDRYRISVEFVSHSRRLAWPYTPPEERFMLEVWGHDMTEAQKRAFSEQATVFLARVLPAKSRSLVARLFGMRADTDRQVAFEFGELSPAIREPFVVHPGSQAA